MVEAANELWTLDELAARISVALAAAGYEGQSSARVREVPDARVVRYYTTLGLVDRPTLQGRTALYSRRHLEQIVAIKRLQSTGKTLADIQQLLLKTSEEELARIANLPEEVTKLPPARPKSEAKEEAKFWSAAPAAMQERIASPAPESKADAGTLSVVKLEAALLLLEPVRALSSEDVDAIRAAAAPLMKVLATRGLVDVE